MYLKFVMQKYKKNVKKTKNSPTIFKNNWRINNHISLQIPYLKLNNLSSV